MGKVGGCTLLSPEEVWGQRETIHCYHQRKFWERGRLYTVTTRVILLKIGGSSGLMLGMECHGRHH